MQQPHYFSYTINSIIPPPTDPPLISQRADEVNTVLRMLNEAQTSTVILTGNPGAGKSTLAALVYHRLQSLAAAGSLPLKHFVWLTLGPNAALPDIIAAILTILTQGAMRSANFFLLKPEQQISLLSSALRRPQESAFIVLDQFEELLHNETAEALVGRGAISSFLAMLQKEPIASRLLLTSPNSPYGSQNDSVPHIRSYLVSRISLPEGTALLQQRGVTGSPEDLSLIWQRCAGQAFALVLVSTLISLSGFSLTHLLNSPDYSPLWNGDVTLNLIGSVFYHLNPFQRTLMRALCLFSEPVALKGIITAILGEDGARENKASDSSFSFERELRQLTQLSLVQQISYPNGQKLYILPSLLRQYTIEHYLEASDRHPSEDLTVALGVTDSSNPITAHPEAREIALAASHIRVAAYYFRLAQQSCPPREKRTGPQDVEPLLWVIRHLCLGWHWQEAYDLLFNEGLHESMLQWGAWNTLIGLYAAMLPPNGILIRRDEGQVASNLGLLYGRLGDDSHSRAYYEQALAIQREIGDQHGEAITLTNQGELFRLSGASSLARANFEQALLLNQQQHDPYLESVLLHNLGLLAQSEKDYQQALSYYRESLRLARDLKDSFNEGLILTNIGMLLYEQGRVEDALAILFYAIQLRQSLNDATAGALIRFLSTVEQKMGPEAFSHLRQAVQGKQEQVFYRLGSSL